MKRPTLYFKVRGDTIPGTKKKGSLNIPNNFSYIIWKRRKEEFFSASEGISKYSE